MNFQKLKQFSKKLKENGPKTQCFGGLILTHPPQNHLKKPGLNVVSTVKKLHFRKVGFEPQKLT